MRPISIAHLALGMLLSGCTYNTTYSSADNSQRYFTHRSEYVGSGPSAHHQQQHPKVTTICETYVPLEVPKPVQVNLDEIKAAADDAAVNKILLRNIAQLNHQLKQHSENQKKHYKAWLSKCTSK